MFFYDALRQVISLAKQKVDDSKIVGSKYLQMSGTVLMLFVFWLIMSGGDMHPKFLFYGLVASVVTTWLCYPLLLVPNADGTRLYYAFSVSIPKATQYFFWLMWQLVLANIDVLLATTAQDMMTKIDPKIIRFKFHADNPLAYAVLANSITLTPGTVTLNVTPDGLYEIHALTPGAADGCLGGDMQRKVAWLFGEGNCNFEVVNGEVAA